LYDYDFLGVTISSILPTPLIPDQKIGQVAKHPNSAWSSDFGLSKSGSATTGTRILSLNSDGTTSTLMTGAESATPTISVAESGTVSPSSVVMKSYGGVMKALNCWYSLAVFGIGVNVVMSGWMRMKGERLLG
jgi:hypothetical protein